MDGSVKVFGTLVSVVAIAVVSMTCACGSKRAAKTSVAQVESLIARELPQKADGATIEAFLDRHGVVHGRTPNGRLISARIRDVDKNLFVTTSIAISFWLDQDGRLVNHEVREEYTGL